MNKKNISPIWIVLLAMIVLRALEGGFSNIGDWFIKELEMIPGIIIGLSFHEFAHAAMSNALGDPTPKRQGRLTVNPIAHIEPIGLIALLLAGFGWGRPVEINPAFYKNRRLGEMLTAFAGVVMNLFIAILFCFILKLLYTSGVLISAGTAMEILADIIFYIIFINIVLMLFNLIPVPPLDGFGILTQLLDLQKYSWYTVVYRYGGFILIALVLFNVTNLFLTPAINAVYKLLINLIIL